MRNILITLCLLAAVACSSSRSPIIGITCSRSDSGSTLLSTTYTEAVSKAGGIPLVIPTVSTPKEAADLLAYLDGIVFSGGEDISPAWYGEEILNETVFIDSLRDRSDSLLARAALASGKPVLAICRGFQLMNVMLGGTLYQDIPSQIQEPIVHADGATHKIGLYEGGLLYRIFGPDSLTVNSFHHQAVKDAAPGVLVTARSEDGLVEAYETKKIIATQFHPEKGLQQGDKRWLKLFSTFVDRCK